MSLNRKSINYRDPAIGLEGRAAARRNTIKNATAGADTLVADFDSSGNALTSKSPRGFDERDAAKDALRRGPK